MIGDSKGSHYVEMLTEMLDSIANCMTDRSVVWDKCFLIRRRAAKYGKQRPRRRRYEWVECLFVGLSDHIRNHNRRSATLLQCVFIEAIAIISFTDKKLRNPDTNCSTDPVRGTKQCTEAEPRMLYVPYHIWRLFRQTIFVRDGSRILANPAVILIL